MALRSGVGGRLLGRGPLCRRGAILDHMGREKVGCCGLSAITLHAEIMPPPAAASNLDSGLSFLRQKRRRRTRAKKQPRARLQSSGKKCLLVWPVCRTGGWGAGGVRRVFTARIYYWLAVWVLLKLSAKHRCKSFRILYAGKGEVVPVV